MRPSLLGLDGSREGQPRRKECRVVCHLVLCEISQIASNSEPEALEAKELLDKENRSDLLRSTSRRSRPSEHVSSKSRSKFWGWMNRSRTAVTNTTPGCRNYITINGLTIHS